MNQRETLRASLEALGQHRLRSFLTVLGILIGIAAVVLTVGLGQGAQAEVRAEIAKLGSNLLVVSPGSSTSTSGVRGGRGSSATLTTADALALGDSSVVPDVAAVAAVSTSSQSLTAGTTNWTTSVVGTTPSWAAVRNRQVSDGRFLTAEDVEQARPVVVLGSSTATELFGPRSPVGQTVQINGSTFTVVGLLSSIGSSSTGDEDDQAVVPSSTFSARVAGSSVRGSVSSIYVEAVSQDGLSAAYQETSALLAARHGSTDFTVSSQQSLLSTATETDRTLTILLGGVAAISLLVGALGIGNMMLVSVSERVREIGLRKALGATPAAVRRQFLVEASTLGVSGGIAGLVLAGVGVAVLPALLDQPVELSLEAAAAAVVVSLVIGVVAGVYPASRAARLAPIDALRTE